MIMGYRLRLAGELPAGSSLLVGNNLEACVPCPLHSMIRLPEGLLYGIVWATGRLRCAILPVC